MICRVRESVGEIKTELDSQADGQRVTPAEGC